MSPKDVLSAFYQKCREINKSLYASDDDIKRALVCMGFQSFKPTEEKSYLKAVQEYSDLVASLMEYDKDVYSTPDAVRRAIVDLELKLSPRTFEVAERELKTHADYLKRMGFYWNFPCPVCGKPTYRVPKNDYLYKAHPLGWECKSGGVAHFYEAIWKPTAERLKAKHARLEEHERLQNGEVVTLPGEGQGAVQL